MRLVAWLAVLGLCLAAFSQQREKKKSAPDRSTKQPSATDAMPQPAPAILTLTKLLAGRWTTQEKYEPMFLTPAGGVGAGEEVFRAGPGGFTLLEDYHTKTPAGELFGTGIVWWDQARGLQHLWCINVYPDGCEMFPPPPQPGPQWDGKQLVIHLEEEQEGKKIVWKEVISDITANSFTQTADIGDSDAHLARWFTIHAVRKTEVARPQRR
jgi:hypothetical protein